LHLRGDRLHLPKFKTGIRVKLHRSIGGRIRHGTISRTAAGKYFVSLLCEEVCQPKPRTGAVCGLDLGLKELITTSEGRIFKNYRQTRKYARSLKSAQQHLSRKVKGSRSFERQRRKVACLHDKIRNSRLDRLHKVSHELVSAYDTICLEDLNVKGMVRNRKLARSISDVSWGALLRMLEYKADWNDRRIVKISRWYPSSKTCHRCGWIKEDLDLSMRVWKCGNGHELDRDVNAAINILREGKRIISAGTVENTGGEKVRPRVRSGRISGKPEAHQSSAGG
jgi:putative transposase